MRRKGLFQPVLLAFFLAGGCLVLWLAAGAWLTAMLQSALQPFQPYQTLVFSLDGTPLLYTAINPYQVEYRDLEGNRFSSPVEAQGSRHAWLLAESLPGPEPRALGSWEGAIRSFSGTGVYWYLISDGRRQPHGYFVGFDSITKARVGYLGLNGFRTEPVPAEEHIPFLGDVNGVGVVSLQRPSYRVAYPYAVAGAAGHPGSIELWDVYLLGRDQKIYHADLRLRTLEIVFSDPSLHSLGLSDYRYGSSMDPDVPIRLLARTEEAVLVLDGSGRLLQRYPIPEPLHNQSFSFLQNSKGEGLMCHQEIHRGLYGGQSLDRCRLWWVTSEGQTRQAEGDLRFPRMETPPLVFGVLCPAPLVLALGVGTFGPILQRQTSEAASYSEGLAQSLQFFYPALILVLVVAVALAVLCYRRQARYGASRAERVAWALFVLALGLPGWVAYRFGCSWPVLERCPSCGATVPRDREQCARCAAAFPEPARKGTEVFA